MHNLVVCIVVDKKRYWEAWYRYVLNLILVSWFCAFFEGQLFNFLNLLEINEILEVKFVYFFSFHFPFATFIF